MIDEKHVLATAFTILISLKVLTEEEIEKAKEKGYEGINDLLLEKYNEIKIIKITTNLDITRFVVIVNTKHWEIWEFRINYNFK